MIRKILITSTIVAIVLNEQNEPIEVTKVVTGKKISHATALKIMREEYGNNILLKDINEDIATYECSIEKFLEIATKIDMKVED